MSSQVGVGPDEPRALQRRKEKLKFDPKREPKESLTQFRNFWNFGNMLIEAKTGRGRGSGHRRAGTEAGCVR